MRQLASTLRSAVAATLACLLAGCSYLSARGPTDRELAGKQDPDCHTSTTPPLVDGILTAAYVTQAALVLAAPDTARELFALSPPVMLTTSAVLAVTAGSSALYGMRQVRRCGEAKRRWAASGGYEVARPLAHAAPAPRPSAVAAERGSGQLDVVVHLAFSADGSALLSAGREGSLNEARARMRVSSRGTLRLHAGTDFADVRVVARGRMGAVAFIADRQRIAGFVDDELHTWEAARPADATKVAQGADGVFSPRARFAAMMRAGRSAQGATIEVIDLATGKTFARHDVRDLPPAHVLLVSDEGAPFAVFARTDNVVMRALAGGSDVTLGSLGEPQMQLSVATLGTNGDVLFVGTDAGTVAAFDRRAARLLRTWVAGHRINAIAPFGAARLAFGSAAGHFWMAPINGGAHELRAQGSSPVLAVACHEATEMCAYSTLDGRLRYERPERASRAKAVPIPNVRTADQR